MASHLYYEIVGMRGALLLGQEEKVMHKNCFTLGVLSSYSIKFEFL